MKLYLAADMDANLILILIEAARWRRRGVLYIR